MSDTANGTAIEVPAPQPLYVQRTGITEQEVNTILWAGYTLWSVTPRIERVKRNGIITSEETTLVYHFLRKKG